MGPASAALIATKRPGPSPPASDSKVPASTMTSAAKTAPSVVERTSTRVPAGAARTNASLATGRCVTTYPRGCPSARATTLISAGVSTSPTLTGAAKRLPCQSEVAPEAPCGDSASGTEMMDRSLALNSWPLPASTSATTTVVVGPSGSAEAALIPSHTATAASTAARPRRIWLRRQTTARLTRDAVRCCLCLPGLEITVHSVPARATPYPRPKPVGGQLGARAKVWTSRPGGAGQPEDFLADPDEALALLFSAGLLEALSLLGLASLLLEPESLVVGDDDSEPEDFDEESESEELLALLEEDRDADPLRESLL